MGGGGGVAGDRSTVDPQHMGKMSPPNGRAVRLQ